MRVTVRGVLSIAMTCAALVGVTACGKNNPPVGDGGVDAGANDGSTELDSGTLDGGDDAGFDAGSTFTCNVATQDCPTGQSCMPYQDSEGTYGSKCFEGECDLVAQNCPSGSKCTYAQTDAGMVARACVDDGTAQEGELCTGTATSNTCKAGLLCVSRNFVDGGTASICLDVCNSDSDCSTGKLCMINIRPDVHSEERPTVCEAPCNLYDAEGSCSPTQACYPGPIAPTCYPKGSTPVGTTCQYGDDCAPGAACVGGFCRQMCFFPSGTPSCTSGECKRVQAANAPDLGVCLQ